MAYFDNKKILLLYILDIIKEYSDEEHPIMQKTIKEKLSSLYGIECDRKTISANINYLEDYGYAIEMTGKGCYLKNKVFSNSELRLLIDSVLYSNHIPKEEAHKLIKKLVQEGNIYFQKTVKNIHNIDKIYHTTSHDFFDNVEILGQAIESQNQVKFNLNEYGTDKKLHPKKEVVLSPYKLIYSNGKYILVGNEDGFDNISTYRIDKISNIVRLDIVVKPVANTIIGNSDINLYLQKNPYMLSGAIEAIRIKTDEAYIGDIIDVFGMNVRIDKKESYGEPKYEIEFLANNKDVLKFALENPEKIEVLSPQSIRDDLRNITNKLYQKYTSNNNDRYNEIINNYVYVNIEDEINMDEVLLNDCDGYCEGTNIVKFDHIDLRDKDEYKTLPDVIGAEFIFNEISDFSFLKNYKNIRYLKIDFNSVEDLDFLADLKKIQKLDLRSTDIDNLDFLKSCKQLRALCLSGNHYIDDYSVLYKLSQLEYLAFTDYERDEIDVKKLKEKMPDLKIYIGTEDNFDVVTGINYRFNIDRYYKKEDYPLNIVTDIFGVIDNRNIEARKEFYRDSNPEMLSILDNIFDCIGGVKSEIIRGIYKEGKSPIQICKENDLTIEEYIAYESKAIRCLRMPKYAKLLINYLYKEGEEEE